MSRAERLLATLRSVVAAYERTAPLLRWLCVAAWAGFLWHESSQQPEPGPKRSALEVWCNNAAHLPAFGLLALLVMLAVRGERGVVTGIVAAACYGVVDEIHQGFTPGRDSSWKDVHSDAIGACLAMALFVWLVRARPRARFWTLVLVPFGVLAPTIAAFW